MWLDAPIFVGALSDKHTVGFLRWSPQGCDGSPRFV